jgi:hypothetical protein
LRAILALGGLLTSAGIVQAQVTVTLPHTSQTTLLTANVSEQAGWSCRRL